MDRLPGETAQHHRRPRPLVSLREQVTARLRDEPEEARAELPRRLKPAGGAGTFKASVARRLAVAKVFGGGASATAKGTGANIGEGQSGSDPAYFVGARQRVMVKAFVGRHGGMGGAKNAGQAVGRHLRYLAREGVGHDGAEPGFYGEGGPLERDGVHAACAGWEDDRHHFRLIISPEHGDRIEDMEGYVRGVMARVAADLKEPRLDWVAINHHDTAQPHAHVLIRGRRANGRDLVIPRRMIAHGIRAHAEEQAQALLGDQSRSQAERGLLARATADRLTDIDIKLASLAERAGGIVPRAEIDRRDVFGAVTRSRLAHLEQLGLVAETGPAGVRLAADLKARLTALQAAQDQIRSHWAQSRAQAFRHCDELTRATIHPLRPPVRDTPTAGVTRASTALPAFDATTERLTPLDVELKQRGQMDAGRTLPRRLPDAVEQNLEARAEWLVSTSKAVRQRAGVGFKPDAWTALRNAEIRLAMEGDLGVRGRGPLTYGKSDGVVIGTVNTSLGRHAIIDHGAGHAAMPLQGGQDVVLGQVIGRGLGAER
jgi:hypothetical protein